MASLTVSPQLKYFNHPHSNCCCKTTGRSSALLPHFAICSSRRSSTRSNIHCNNAHPLDLNSLPPFLAFPFSQSQLPLKPTHICVQQSGVHSRSSNNFHVGCCSSGSRNNGWEVMSVGVVKGLWESIRGAFLANPPTWESAIVANATIFLVGAQLLRAGLTGTGIAHAFVLAVLTWRAFAGQGLLLAAIFFIMGTAATKVKIKQKEVERTAEKRKGRRGPASVWGSGSAGTLCALAAIAGYGGPSFSPVWKLAFVASFCTKLSDTVSSEIGKAYGKTTYLVSTLQIVPRGTEGAVSIEGTAAGLVASFLFSGAAYALNQVDVQGAVICVVASQIANLFESYVGALLQGQSGYEWLNNDVVNILNVTLGATLSILSRSLMS